MALGYLVQPLGSWWRNERRGRKGARESVTTPITELSQGSDSIGQTFGITLSRVQILTPAI